MIHQVPGRPTLPLLLVLLAAGCDDGGTSLAGDAVDDAVAEDAAPVDVEPDRPAETPADAPGEAEDDAGDVPPDGPTTRPVDLTPSCVHVPALVGAGGPFPIAVFGETGGCVTYDHAELSVSGSGIDVRLVGLEDLVGPCPSCLSTYVGLVWLDAPTPGAYVVRVAGWPAETVVASGGAYEDPVCATDCPPVAALGERSWTLARVDGGEVHGGCGDYVNLGTTVAFTGSCREWTAAGADWSFPARTLHCTDTDLFFGPSAPYDVDASHCAGAGPASNDLILGLANHGSTAELFLLESD